jgi:ATP-dependent DNA ligase
MSLKIRPDILLICYPAKQQLEEFFAKIEQLKGEGLVAFLLLLGTICSHLSFFLTTRIMLRKPKSLYICGRSHVLRKIKSFFDAEAIVIGHVPGKVITLLHTQKGRGRSSYVYNIRENILE